MSPLSGKAAKGVRYALLTVFVLAWAGAFVATHLRPDDVPDIHTGDKVAHCVGYGVLAMLLAGMLTSFGRSRFGRVALVLVILLAYGAFDELTQPAFGRTSSVYDWLADVAGVAIALALWETLLSVLCISRRRGRRG